MNDLALAEELIDAVRRLDFAATADSLQGGAAVGVHPSLDLAVIGFPAAGGPFWANVLFSSEHPQGLAAAIDGNAAAVRDIRFLADQRDAQGISAAWQPGADWQRFDWQWLGGSTDPHAPRFVAPYPASLLKLMVAVAVGIVHDAGAVTFDEPWPHAGRTRAVWQWCEDMVAFSSNDSTAAMIALLHARRALGETDATRNVLHARLQALGLPTLRLDGTRADGGWGNAAGAGVGRIQMTAWDTARLLWLLDPAAPPAPWPGGQPILSPAARDRVLGWLADQAWHEMLSSTALVGIEGFRPGIPAHVPERWIDGDGRVTAGSHHYPHDIRGANAAAEVDFLHKTGCTENYASDAGIVRGRAPNQRHYIVALLSNLGSRYAAAPLTATTWRIPALGAAVDASMRRRLGP